MIPQYAGVGEVCPQFGIAVTSGGSLTADSLYFSFQLQNRAGFNIPSVSAQIAFTTNQKIIITIPEMPDGWDVHYFVISAGATNDPTTHVQIARVGGFQFGIGIEPQSVKTLLPAVLELTRNIHIALAPSVTSVGSFPMGADRLDGQVRWVTDEAKWFEYRADSTLPVSVDVIAADIGQWVRIGGPSTYVSDTRAGVGCDRPIVSINPITVIPTPPYPGETLSKFLPSWEAKYWIYNDLALPLPAGTEFGIELEYNNKRSPDLLSGLVRVKFIGFVTSDGTIRTQDAQGRDFPNLGAFFPWTPKLTTPFITIDDLQPGEAIALAVKPFFSVAEFTVKDVIGIFPTTRIQSGDYNPLGMLFTQNGKQVGTVFDIGDRYRVVPNVGLNYDILSGIALVNSYNPPEKPRRTFGGLQQNTEGQQVIINGSASVFTETSSYTPSASEGVRAIVSTVAGESVSSSEWSSYVAITAGATLTLSYPCDANGVGTIRADYPDVVADDISKNKGLFNPFGINIYLQRQDNEEVRRFSGFGVVAAASQQFTISNWTAGTVATLPTAGDDFSLFAPLSGAIAPSITGNFPSTNYRVAYSFVYDGNQITSISHASPPCIKEFEGDLQPPTVTIGVVETLPPGENASIINSGTGNQAILDFGLPIAEIILGAVITLNPDEPPDINSIDNVLNFGLPRSPTFVVGTVTTLNPGDSAIVENVGTDGDIVLDLGIPSGIPGSLTTASSIVLTPVSTPPATGVNEVALFADATDGNIKTRSQSNGAIAPISIIPVLATDLNLTGVGISTNYTTTVPLGKVFTLLKVSSATPCRIRLYSRADFQSLDLSRGLGVASTGVKGLLFEGVTSLSLTTIILSPLAIGANLENTIINDIPTTINNLSGAIASFDITFVHITNS